MYSQENGREIEEEFKMRYQKEQKIQITNETGKNKHIEPSVTGDEKICIIKHNIYRHIQNDEPEIAGVYLNVKNVSTSIIGSVTFGVIFYDIEDNIVEETEYKKFELLPDKDTIVHIPSKAGHIVESYSVKTTQIIIAPMPVVIDNDKVTITKHGLVLTNNFPHSREWKEIDIAVHNISESNIAKIILEAIFYDIEGNVLDITKREEYDLTVGTSRSICIIPSVSMNNSEKFHYRNIWSYAVRIIKTVTADVEKVRLCRHEAITLDNGWEEVRGIVKNISDGEADTVLVATFKNYADEKIATKIIPIKSIKPRSYHNFHFVFQPSEGEKVKTYSLDIGEIAEGVT